MATFLMRGKRSDTSEWVTWTAEGAPDLTGADYPDGGGSVITDSTVSVVRRIDGGGAAAAADLTDVGTAGLAVVQAETAATASIALGLELAPLGSPGSWTLDPGASVASSTLTVAASGAASGANGRYVHGMSARGLELVGRLVAGTPGAAPTHAWLSLGLCNSDGSRSMHVQMRADGYLALARVSSGWSFAPSDPGPAVDAAGTWVRILYCDDGRAVAYYSTASTLPASEDDWTYLGEQTSPITAGAWAASLFGSMGTDGSGAACSGTITGIRLRGMPA